MSHAKKIATARLWASKRWPYFTSAMLALVPKEVPDGTFEHANAEGTLAVDANLVLSYEPRAITRFTVPELGSVLVHEVWHVIRRHGTRRGTRDPRLWNAAADMEINDDLGIESGYVLPDGGGVHPTKYGLPTGRTAEEYYALLQQQTKPPPCSGAGSGECGACAREKPQGGSDGDGDGDAQDDADARSAAEVEAVVRATVKAMQETKAQGKLPLGMARWVDGALEPPKIAWERRVLSIARRAATVRAGSVLHRYDRVSRRQSGLGFGIGAAVLPRYVAPEPHVVFAFDTSGSMGDPAMKRGISEVDGLLRGIGAKVTFVSCDAEVHEMKEIASAREATKLIKGGGGTDFRPVFDAIEARGIVPDLLAFLTDGYGTAPKAAPAYKVLWILVPGGTRPAPWGEVVDV